jgi:hypothetical protein
LFDQVRGAVNALRSDLQNAEATTNSSGALSAFNSNGFTLANGSSGSDQAILTHQSGYTYVAWAWDANGAGSSNTDGTITSTVSANPTAGFSIVTYTGTGSTQQLVMVGRNPIDMHISSETRAHATGWLVIRHSQRCWCQHQRMLELNEDAGVAYCANIWFYSTSNITVFQVGDWR